MSCFSAVSEPQHYQAVDHGYAATIHKNQGATVDRAFVLASGSMDRHLTYVAMTRHRDGAQLYASQAEFTDRKAGQTLAPRRLVEHGKARYDNDPKNRDNYFVTLENDKGQKHTAWGVVDIEVAMKDAAPPFLVGKIACIPYCASGILPTGNPSSPLWPIRSS